jgi:hypothetical protein
MRILVGRSDGLLIRIDWVNNAKGYRYVAWSKGHAISQKPDVVIFHGDTQNHGNMGGWAWTFTNGDLTYVVDDIETCAGDSQQDCGLFLHTLFKGTEKSVIRLQETK